MERARRALKLARCPEVSPRSRVAALCARALPRGDTWLSVQGAAICLSREDFATDWAVLIEIFVNDEYAAIPYERRTVLDAGAHKGYFAAYALARGARRVISYEPEPRNYRYLSRVSASDDFDARNLAIAAQSGELTLALDTAWSHSLRLDQFPGARTVSVPATTLAEAIASSGAEIVKLDIEGAERDVLAATVSDDWAGVSLLVLEVHAWATTPDEIAQLMADRGMRETARGRAEHPVMHFEHERTRSAR